MDWAQIIIVLLIVVLSLFVIVALTLFVMLVRVSLRIRSLVRSAHTAAENVSGAIAGVGGAIQVVEIVKSLMKKTKDMQRKSRSKK